MTTLADQMTELKRQEMILKKKKMTLELEILYQDKDVTALEQTALTHANELSTIFTHLRDKHGKRYKLHSGFLMTPRVDIRIIEPGTGQGGYDRYLD
jgi:hypothetical protein